MKVLLEFIEIFASFIELYIVYNIYENLLVDYRVKTKHKEFFLLSVLGAIVIRICNSVSVFSYFTMLIWVIYVSISICLIYKVNYIIYISIASIYLLILSCFDFAVLTLISNWFGGYETFVQMITVDNMIRVGVIIIVKILWITTYWFLRGFLNKISFKKNHGYTIIIVSLLGYIGFVYLVNQTLKSFHQSISGIWFLFLAFSALCIFTGYYVVESRERKMKLHFSEMRNTLLEEKYQSMNEIYTSNATLYHDLNNHLNVLYQLLEAGNQEEAKAYIKDISKPIMKLSKTIWTGVDVVDVIINSKLEQMEVLGIQSNVQVEFPKNTNILARDICTILSNLLDNAIEATQFVEEPDVIELTIRRVNYMLLIKVSNSCVQDREFVEYPKTTKENKKMHGWGIPSVKETVEKYNGTLKLTKDNGRFTASALLCFEPQVK